MGKIAKLFENGGNLNILRIICIKGLIIFENSKWNLVKIKQF